MGASPSIISSSWRRTKIPRFQSFEDAAAADEEAMLIHQLEMLEIQEEIDNEDDDEDFAKMNTIVLDTIVLIDCSKMTNLWTYVRINRDPDLVGNSRLSTRYKNLKN
jgi:hypothetical protein